MTTTKSTGRFAGRTKLITIASIVAIGIAGAGAVSANLGILDAADNSNVGALSAAGDLAAPTPQVVDVYVDDPTTTAATTAVTAGTTAVVVGSSLPAAQEFSVDVAGTVAIAATQTGIRLDGVSPAAGWTWSLAQTEPTGLAVTFTDGVRTLEFVAVAGADGTINATVSEPIVTAAAVSPTTGGYQDDHESDDDSEDDDSHEEYEGGEDDD